MREATVGNLCGNFQMLYRALPGPGFLKVMRQDRCNLRVWRFMGFEPFATSKMNSRAPRWRLSLVEHLSIQGVRELIFKGTTCTGSSRGTQDVLLARQALAEILKI